MRFSDFYGGAGKPIISFELYPPKTDAALETLMQVVPELVALRPSFMTVTYGAGGSTRARTLEIASSIQKRFQVPTACHLTCVGSSRDELDRILGDIHSAGVQNIVALRGDPPMGETEFKPAADGYSNANELVEHIHSAERRLGIGPFGIAVAGYPEKHIQAPDLETDIRNLKRKVAAGADCVISQLFYDNRYFFEFVDKARKEGISIPIIPGLLPVLSGKQVLRITALCGACLPEGLKADLDAAGDDVAKAEAIGVRQCVKQARELLDRGARGIHFYVLNKSSHMREIMKQLSY